MLMQILYEQFQPWDNVILFFASGIMLTYKVQVLFVYSFYT